MVIGLRALVDQADLQVVLQVLADAGQLVHDRDAVRVAAARAGPMPDSCSSCGDWIAPAASSTSARAARVVHRAALAVAHADGAAALEQQAGGLRLGLDAQVGPPPRRPQIGLRGAAAPALAGGELVVAGAFLRRAVEVVVARHAELAGAGDEGLDQLVLRRRCPTPRSGPSPP